MGRGRVNWQDNFVIFAKVKRTGLNGMDIKFALIISIQCRPRKVQYSCMMSSIKTERSYKMTISNPRNEICTCGHLQADHGRLMVVVPNHGPCDKCTSCIQYTWNGWVDRNGKPTDEVWE